MSLVHRPNVERRWRLNRGAGRVRLSVSLTLPRLKKDLTYREEAGEAKAFGSLVCDNQRMNG